MQNSEADKQIVQMIEFIKQEAREKADEIFVKTEAEFNAKKLQQIVKARQELKEEYANKRKDVASKKRIARSRAINNARFEQMRERDRLLKELKNSISGRLNEVSGHKQYPQFLQLVIVQGLLTILEHNVELQCREVDAEIVKKVLPQAIHQFKDIVKAETGVHPEITVDVNTREYLPPPPSHGYTGATCSGGVVLTARFGKIVCRNTLDARFEKAFGELLPAVRNTLFGKRAMAKIGGGKHDDDEKKHN